MMAPDALLAVALIAAYLMISAGVAKRRLVWRNKRCPSCGQPHARCTCYWR
jgi:hypothetical protein